MFVTIVLAALIVDLAFSGLGLIPETRPTTEEMLGSIETNYKLVLNAVATVAFAVLWGLTLRGAAPAGACELHSPVGH